LELDGLRVEVNRANLEVDTDGGDVRFSVRVVGETQQQARLADAGVADQQKFEEVVAGTGEKKKHGERGKGKNLGQSNVRKMVTGLCSARMQRGTHCRNTAQH